MNKLSVCRLRLIGALEVVSAGVGQLGLAIVDRTGVRLHKLELLNMLVQLIAIPCVVAYFPL